MVLKSSVSSVKSVVNMLFVLTRCKTVCCAWLGVGSVGSVGSFFLFAIIFIRTRDVWHWVWGVFYFVGVTFARNIKEKSVFLCFLLTYSYLCRRKVKLNYSLPTATARHCPTSREGRRAVRTARSACRSVRSRYASPTRWPASSRPSGAAVPEGRACLTHVKKSGPGGKT